MLLAGVLLLGSCGDDDDEPDRAAPTPSESTTTTEATGSPSTTTIDDPEAFAESVNLTAEDLPDGYEARAPDETGPDPLEECFTEVDPNENLAEAESPTFASGQGGEFRRYASVTSVFGEAGIATALVDEVGTPTFAECATRVLNDDLAEDDLTIQGLELAVDDNFPTQGEQSVVLVGDFTSGTGESEVAGGAQLVFIRTGVVASRLLNLNVGQPVDADTFLSLAGTIADRQEGAR